MNLSNLLLLTQQVSLELWCSSDMMPHHNLHLYAIFPPNSAERILSPKNLRVPKDRAEGRGISL